MASQRAALRNIVVVTVLFGLFVVIGIAFRFLIYPMLREDLVAVTGSESRYLHEVTIRLDSFSGYAGLRTTAFRKDLQEQGIKLQLEDDGADYVARTKALQRGDAQMAVFTIDAFVSSGAARGEFPGTIIMVIDETYGADAIVAYKATIPNLQALNDPEAQLVLTPGSPSEFLGRVAIAEFGLTQLSSKWVEEDGAGAVYERLRKDKQSLKRGYVLWEPFKSQALEDPLVHVLFDTSRVTGYVVDVLVAQRQFLLDHPDVVRAVVEAHLRTMDSYQDRLVQLVMEDAKAQGDALSQKQAQKVVDGIRWRNTLENYTHFGLAPPAAGILLLEDSIANIADVLVRTGGLSKNPVAGRANELFYQGTLQQMKDASFHPQKKLGIVDGGLGTGDLDGVAGEAELQSLTNEEWDQLTPVGSMQVQAISFGRGTARLNINSQRELDALARRLHSLPHFYLTVKGHTRAEGDAEANRKLAEERAQAAMDYLVTKGVDRIRLRSVATEPVGTGGAFQSVSFVLAQQPY